LYSFSVFSDIVLEQLKSAKQYGKVVFN